MSNDSYLVTRWFGSFLVENGRIADKRLFPNNPKAIAERLKLISEGSVLGEERELAGGRKTVVSEKRLSLLGRYAPEDDNFRLAEIDASALGFEMKLLHAASLELGRLQTRESSTEPDRQISQAINAMEDVINTANLLLERLREWYGLYSPEVVEGISDGEQFARKIAEHGKPSGILKELGIDESTALGAEMGDADEAAVRQLANSLINLYESKHDLELHIDETMMQIAPNISKVIGSGIAARMLAIAGTVENLAMMPASTIQLLGAEKALFRYLKEGGKPPKHGYIYQYRAVNTSPWWQRGKIARMMAAKLVTAAKADAFTKRDVAAEIAAGIDNGIQEIKRKYPSAPEKKKGAPGGFSGRPQQGGFKGHRGGGGPVHGYRSR